MHSNIILFAHHDGSLAGSTISLGKFWHISSVANLLPEVARPEGPADSIQALGIMWDVVPAFRFGTFPGPHPWKLSWLLNWRAFLPNPGLSRYLKTVPGDLLTSTIRRSFGRSGGQPVQKPIVWHLRAVIFNHSRVNARASAVTIRSIADQVLPFQRMRSTGLKILNPSRSSITRWILRKPAGLWQRGRKPAAAWVCRILTC
jgi:hypothetical protein